LPAVGKEPVYILDVIIRGVIYSADQSGVVHYAHGEKYLTMGGTIHDREGASLQDKAGDVG
jgi:hypothetical protein